MKTPPNVILTWDDYQKLQAKRARQEVLNVRKQDDNVEMLDLLDSLVPAALARAEKAEAATLREAHMAELKRKHGEMAQYLTDAREFSLRTFGPGKRTGGVTKHIEKELDEIREKPDDLTEWVDVIILACDGYWRHGGQPETLMADMMAKLAKNKLRKWPTPTSEDEAIEHDRTYDDPLNPDLGPEHREYWIRKTEAAALADKGVSRG